MQIARHYIDGEWLSSVSGSETLAPSYNPATAEVAAQFADGHKAEAEAAIAAAVRAFEGTAWKNSAKLRAEVLLGFADRLEAQK